MINGKLYQTINIHTKENILRTYFGKYYWHDIIKINSIENALKLPIGKGRFIIKNKLKGEFKKI